MNQQEGIFVGRHDELLYYTEACTMPTNISTVRCIVGEPGVGKSAFMQKVLERLKDSGADRSIFFLEKSQAQLPLRKKLSSMVGSAFSMNGQDHSVSDSVRAQFSPDSDRLDFSKQEAEPEFFNNMLVKAMVEARATERVLIYLDDFEQWTDRAQSDFLGYVVRPLMKDSVSKNLEFFVTLNSEQDTFDWINGAGLTSNHFHVLEVGPLEEEESRELINRLAPDSMVSDSLVFEAKGNPGLLRELVEVSGSKKSLGKDVIENRIEKIVHGCNDKQLGILYAASFLANLSTDGLGVLVGRPVSNDEMRWVGLKFGGAVYRKKIRPELKIAMVKWCETNWKRCPKMDKEKSAKLVQILDILPVVEERQQLLKFSPFLHFDTSVVEAAYPRDYKLMLEFIKNYPELFEQVGGCMCVAKSFQLALRDYAKFLGFDANGNIRKKLQALWVDREREIHKSIEKWKEKLKHTGSIKEDIEQKVSKAKKHLDSFSKKQQAQGMEIGRVGVAGGAQGGRFGGFFLGAAGVYLLYMGILYSDRFNPVYAGFGMVCLFVGALLFFKNDSASLQSQEQGRAQEEQNMATMGRNAKDMELKMLMMQSHRSAIAANLGREKKKLDELSELLEHPYFYE